MSRPRNFVRTPFWRMWGWPIVLGLLTATGLTTALVSDNGWGDWWSWIGLGVPVAVMAWSGWRRPPSAPAHGATPPRTDR